jgi:hypothetical protein
VTETGPAEQGPFHVRRCARRLDWQVLGGSIVVYTAPDSQEGAVYLPAHEVGLSTLSASMISPVHREGGRGSWLAPLPADVDTIGRTPMAASERLAAWRQRAKQHSRGRRRK